MNSTVSIHGILENQKQFFRSGATQPEEFRRESLQKLYRMIEGSETRIAEALQKDLRKSVTESYIGEIALTLDETKFALKHLSSWMRPKKFTTPLTQWPGKTFLYSEPLGTILVIGPWNYPFQLLIAPLIGAIAAGNTAVLKPSEIALHTSRCVTELIGKTFSPEFISVVEGGVETSQALLEERWDHIFFTGGTQIGRVVMQSAAKYLTPVTLELGGKSPCIVDKETDLKVTARRIAWGKFFNAGQTCVAPDYVLVPKQLKLALIEEIKESVDHFFGADPLLSPDYARIVSDRHYQRLKGFLGEGKIAFGGKCVDAERFISPTLLMNVEMGQKIMQEEIFGPLLPILEYDSLDQAIAFVKAREKPLALYFFSNHKENAQRVLREISFGGGCVNDTLVHLANPRVPFGGVGESGMGAYHGQSSFEAFSHKKSVLKRGFFPDIRLRYPPYAGKLDLLKKILG